MQTSKLGYFIITNKDECSVFKIINFCYIIYTSSSIWVPNDFLSIHEANLVTNVVWLYFDKVNVFFFFKCSTYFIYISSSHQFSMSFNPFIVIFNKRKYQHEKNFFFFIFHIAAYPKAFPLSNKLEEWCKWKKKYLKNVQNMQNWICRTEYAELNMQTWTCSTEYAKQNLQNWIYATCRRNSTVLYCSLHSAYSKFLHLLLNFGRCIVSVIECSPISMQNMQNMHTKISKIYCIFQIKALNTSPELWYGNAIYANYALKSMNAE